MADVTEHFKDSGFKVFAGMIEKDPKVRVWAIPAPTGGSRAFCDRMNSWAQGEGQPGLGYIYYNEELGPEAGSVGQSMVDALHELGASELAAKREMHPTLKPMGPVAKNIGETRATAIARAFKDDDRPYGLRGGDAVFFAAGNPANFYKFAGAARDRIGQELKLIKEDRFALAWIVDFPFYEWNEEEKKIDFSHNPFSMPQGGGEALDAATTTEARLKLKAYQYDIVCNGYEIASGGIRNHKPDAMIKAFGIAGLGPEVVEQRFGGLFRAFQYGAPPHGGMAAGIERIVMLLTGGTTVREVALFPMNQQANDLLMGAPSEVSPKQLRELSIRIVPPEKKT
jgi:aspartyl-tRNA synthetase